MKAQWTQEQQEAINSRDENLLVSAGAGSGKTAVMTERIVSLIMQDVDLKNMLVVTFTNAAASEMKRRFQMRLAEIAKDKEQDSKMRDRARAQMESFSQANISTLHAFCTQVLRRHFHEVDLDPAFRITDDYEGAILRRESIDEVVEQLFDANDPDFLAFEDAFGDRYDGLEQLLLRVYSFMMSLPDPWDWLEQSLNLYDITEEQLKVHPIYQLYCEQAISQLSRGVEWLEQGRSLLPEDLAYDKVRAQLDDECMRVRGAVFQLQQGMLTQLEKKSSVFATLRFPTKKDTPPAPNAEQIKALRNDTKAIWESLEKHNWSPEYQAEKMRDMLPALLGLKKALKQFAHVYNEKKREKSLVDFSDLEHLALAALRMPLVAEEYRERFSYVFVDEYQDSNALQEEIVQYVSRENRLFCVGDSKQSIYRFRAADPSLFLERARRYQEEETGRVIPLNQNFRSQSNILHAVNDVFRIAMPLGGEQTYLKEDMLYAGQSTEADMRPVSIYILDKKGKQDEDLSEDQELGGMQAEAMQIVQCIRERLGKPIFDAKQNKMRPTTYRDFAILLRTVRSSSEIISRILSEQGIPSYADLSGGYFDALEIQIFIDLLRLVDNRDQDLPWLSIIRAGFFGFSDEGLVTMRINAKQHSFLQAIELQAREMDDLGAVCQRALGFMQEAKERSLAMRLSYLIEWVLGETQYFAIIAAQSGAKQRKANMESFLKLAQTYESVVSRGLNGFLGFLEGFQEAGEDKGEARLSGEGADCVHIISIHKSKGLEYPIVFVAQCGKNRNRMDQQKKILLHRNQGIGLKFVDLEKRLIGDTLPWVLIRDMMEQESIAEELRVLYVAMTRAMNELILIGSVSNMDKSVSNWAEQKSNQTMLDFIMGALMQLDIAPDWKEQYGVICGGQSADAQWRIQTVSAVGLSPINTMLNWSTQMDVLFEQSQGKDIVDIAKRLEWTYDHEVLPGKVTVSSLSHGRTTLDTTPRFLLPKRMTAADRGVIMHTFLQHVDWNASLDAKDIQKQANQLVEREILSTEEAEALRIPLLESFFCSPLSKRMMNATIRYREMPFTMQVKANELYQGAGSGIISVQGVVDACFLEEDEWILLDYKTDFVHGRGAEANFEAAQKHALQLSLYAQALAKMTGKVVRERYVVLLSVCEAVKIPADTPFERPDYHHEILHTTEISI